MSFLNKLKGYESITVFLIFEVLALASFNLGGISVIFHFAGFVVGALSFLFSARNFNKKELLGLLFLIIPLFLFAIFTNFGGYYLFSDSTINCIGGFFGIIGFFLMGLSARHSESFNIKTCLICIGGGLALLVLINTISTWIDYGPFYPLIHSARPDGYYRGYLINLTQEMNSLFGFKFYETKIPYGIQFAVILSASLPALLFINRKKETKLFLSVAIFGVIGLISVLTITNFSCIVIVIFAFVVGVLYRFFRDNNLFKKMGKIALIIVLAIVALFAIFAIVNVSGNNTFSRIVAGNGFLNKLFNSNRFMQNVNPVLKQMFVSSNLTGFKYKSAEDYEAIFLNTGHIELELLKEGGFFGLIFIIVFGVFSFFSFKRYLKQSKDCHWVKVILLCALLTYVFFETFFYDAFPIIHIEKYHNPASRSMLFLIFIFVIGYIATPKNASVIEFENKQKENKKLEKSSHIVDEDYDFSDSDIKEGKNE